MNKTVKDTLRLVAITLVAVLCLALVYEVTKDLIAEAEVKERMDSYRSVYPDAADFAKAPDPTVWAFAEDVNVKVNEAFYAVNAAGEHIGCVLSVTSPNGYGGDVVLSMGLTADGTIVGVTVTSMSETAGLGAKCQEESFISQFAGINAWSVTFTKTGKSAPNEIDAITGATYTTRAVTEAVNAGISFAREVLGMGKGSV